VDEFNKTGDALQGRSNAARGQESGAAYAASQKLSEEEALQKGMQAKAVEFVKQRAEIYRKE
jgi:hypothetical protein